MSALRRAPVAALAAGALAACLPGGPASALLQETIEVELAEIAEPLPLLEALPALSGEGGGSPGPLPAPASSGGPSLFPSMAGEVSAAPGASVAVSTLPFEGPPEKKLLDSLATENQLERERLTQKLRPFNQEKEELSTRYALHMEKLKLELAELEAQKSRLAAQNALAEEKSRAELAEQRHQRERVRLDNELERERLQAEMAKQDLEKAAMELESRRMDFRSRKMKFEAEEREQKAAQLRTDLELRAKEEEWKAETNKEPEYPREPFSSGRLVVSDRRIPLNGPILRGTADHVSERLDYFNNKSAELPIFIVIDSSPGGSVMQGYRIVKAMQASKAPVTVVVKSYAASMAAVIAALAPRSLAYPNAVILHHQMSSFVFGNMTQMREQLEVAQEWYRRLGEPVARKMGVSLEAFTRQMYAHSSDGDWEEFGDEALKLGWVDGLVHEIRETGVVKHPDKALAPKPAPALAEETDAKGDRFARLPRLDPFDLYYLYNRDGYYR